MTTLHYTDDQGSARSIEAAAFVLNGKTLLAVDESGHKRAVAFCVKGAWCSSEGRLKGLRFSGEQIAVRHQERELLRADSLRLTGSRGRLPRLGDVATLDHGVWHADTAPLVGRLVLAGYGVPAPVRAALAA